MPDNEEPNRALSPKLVSSLEGLAATGISNQALHGMKEVALKILDTRVRLRELDALVSQSKAQLELQLEHSRSKGHELVAKIQSATAVIVAYEASLSDSGRSDEEKQRVRDILDQYHQVLLAKLH